MWVRGPHGGAAEGFGSGEERGRERPHRAAVAQRRNTEDQKEDCMHKVKVVGQLLGHRPVGSYSVENLHTGSKPPFPSALFP